VSTSTAMSAALQSLRYKRGSLQVLDQLKVPQSKEYVDVPDAEAAWKVVKSMQVRGAPLIAIVSALGLAVEAERPRDISKETPQAAAAWLRERTARLRTSRPTAVNLFKAMDELEGIINEATKASRNDQSVTAADVYAAYIEAAEAMLDADVSANKSIGEHGADAILKSMEANGAGSRGAKILTICNTGSLATAGWGTALGIIRSVHARGRLDHAYALETRPYNQGARLTAFELVEDKIPGTLVCDSMAAALMQRKGIDACVVGADRVAANGDTANKIGTYGLSVIARHHGVPFYVAAPTTTLDAKTPSGAEIPIEERPGDELACLSMNGKTQRLAPEGILVWNPAFDVTPHNLISGVVTERGLVPSENRETGKDSGFGVAAFLADTETSAAKRRKTGSA